MDLLTKKCPFAAAFFGHQTHVCAAGLPRSLRTAPLVSVRPSSASLHAIGRDRPRNLKLRGAPRRRPRRAKLSLRRRIRHHAGLQAAVAAAHGAPPRPQRGETAAATDRLRCPNRRRRISAGVAASAGRQARPHRGPRPTVRETDSGLRHRPCLNVPLACSHRLRLTEAASVLTEATSPRTGSPRAGRALKASSAHNQAGQKEETKGAANTQRGQRGQRGQVRTLTAAHARPPPAPRQP